MPIHQATNDIIVVGGGLAGSTFGKAMAERGARVLILDRETQFRDRVRGENVHPWGITETRRLDIFDLLVSSCGNLVPNFERYQGGTLVLHIDLVARYGEPELTFYHPAMQEVLIQGAADAGAEVRRGVSVRDVRPQVTVQGDGRTGTVEARLIVCADGRNSLARRRGGFTVQRDPKLLLLADLLFDDMPVPVDTMLICTMQLGRRVLIFPLGRGRVRLYYEYHYAAPRLQGPADVRRFVEAAVLCGAPAEYFLPATAAGPLATFDCADNWVDHPYRDGLVLIGDAAASSDPTQGTGMSLALRDVRTLRDCLRENDNWDRAAHHYAEEHDRYYGVIHTVDGWIQKLFHDLSPEGDALRARALPLYREDPTRVPDHIVGGPDLPLNETTRRRFFGEE